MCIINCEIVDFFHVADSELNGRAWLLWSESVVANDKTVFLAVRAKGYNEFKKGNTDDADIVPMGIDCPLT